MTPTPQQDFADRLHTYLRERYDRSATVINLERLAGGVSNEIWSFDLAQQGAGHAQPLPMVLRMDMAHPLFPGSRAMEGTLLQHIHGRGLPVPRVYWCEPDAGPLGGSFFIMERVAGESLINHLQQQPRYAHARERIVPQLGEALAQIQQTTPHDVFPPQLRVPARTPREALVFFEQDFRRKAVDPHPVLELGLRWLYAHLPPERPLVLAHGDYRIQNVIYDESGVRAILDWELAHFGDPMEDVAWIALRSWRGSRDELEICGVGTREDFIAAYERAGGMPVDAERLRFWDIFANLIWAAVTVIQLHSFLSGQDNIELANLGRRTAEMEWDLLQLLERTG